MPTLKLAHIVIKVLDAKLMVGPNISAFQHRPERFDPVGARLIVNVLAGTVADRLARVGQPIVGGAFVCVQLYASSDASATNRCKFAMRVDGTVVALT